MHRSPASYRRLSMAIFEALEERRMFGGGGPEPIFPDVYEPNNSFAAAWNLGTTNATILPGLTLHNTPVANDVDYFKFTASSTAAVGVVIDFLHADGNLQLTAYNSAQQQIAHANTSTFTRNRESFALNLAAGQTYFIKVSGATSGVSQPDYSLSVQALSASFDWSMPKRFGALLDQWGLPVIPNTRDYGRPNPMFFNSIEHPTYPLRLDASSSFLGTSDVTYNWTITGSSVGTLNVTGGPLRTVDLPEGQYSVTLSAVVTGGPTLTTSHSVSVVDHLIVAMGDSYGSGEGNPHLPQQFDILGFTTSGAKWAQGDNNDDITASHRRAHRSSWAGVVKAAVDLENSDPKSSVTFVFLSHTGATIPEGMLGWQNSGDPGQPGSDQPQVNQLTTIVGNRRIDGLVMSIGGNDTGFLDIASRLVAADPSEPNYQSILQSIWDDATNYRNELVNVRYPQLKSALVQFEIGQVFLTEYPDPTHDSSGGTAQQILHDIVGGYEVDQYELNEVRDRVMVPLAKSMASYAKANGWQYVNDIASAFNTHGYGDWFRTASDSVIIQGPVFNRNFPSTEEKAATTGTLHPTPEGQEVYRQRVGASLMIPNLAIKNFSLTPNAFVTGATDGYTIFVKNVSLTGSAPASVARLYLSPDATVNASDTMVLEFNVPALAPGQTAALTGTIPHITDPYRNPANIAYVAPVLDVYSQVAESNEADNVAVGINDLATVKPERDIAYNGFNFIFSGASIPLWGTYSAGLGTDELIGQYDMDLYAFQVNAGQSITFDLDALPASGLDTYVRLYSMSGDFVNFTPLASNDDARAPGEPTANNGESFLSYTFANASRYCLVVSHAVNGDVPPMTLQGRQPGVEGDYTLTVTNVAPQPLHVTSAAFDYLRSPHEIRLTFDANVGASLSLNDLQILNWTTNQTIPTANITLHYTSPENRAVYKFSNYTYGALPDGNYRATLPAGSVSDAFGNTLLSDYVLEFFFLNGDANRDRRVNLQDFNILAANFGNGLRNFTQGDFTYDSMVNLADFNLLASRFGTALGTAGAGESEFGDEPIRATSEPQRLMSDVLAAAGLQ